jgi:hypothetical protein
MMNIVTKIVGLILLQFLLSASLYAQKHITEFLGIPVDGYKPEMIKKLRDKGYVISPSNKDVLVGEFNGVEVEIHIGTNNNKVYRIMVTDANPRSEGDIKIRFNKLYQQFENNKKYMPDPLSTSDYISEDEDISYELLVHNKRYQAAFYQLPTDLDTTALAKEMQDVFLTKYTEKQLSNLTEKEDIMMLGASYLMDKYSKNSVWFAIDELYGKYYIIMFYDNGYNQANGEDL